MTSAGETPTDAAAVPRTSFAAQLQRNAVALISLAIAVCSLSYNTWRNETTEQQRNLRHAAFEVINHLEQFQSVVNAMVYPTERRTELWVDGWGEVKAGHTLSTLLPEPVPQMMQTLLDDWSTSVDTLRGEDRAAAEQADEALTATLNRCRQAVLTVIQNLE
ncbi:MAG: hypothetical protein AAF736_12275 [Pseudomonadota bacterium]